MPNGGVQYGHIKMAGGYPILYEYRLDFQEHQAYKFVVPAFDVKGKLHLYKGYTPEDAVALYKKDVAKKKLIEATLTLAKAKERLFERRGSFWKDRWEVVRLKDLGTFDPAMDETLVESAEAAVKDLVRTHG
jgi:hypothetical protein